MLTKESAIFSGQDSAPSPSHAGIRPFTERQRDVLGLLIRGYTSKEIAVMLEIDDRTVDYHVARMCLKAGVWSRRELVIAVLSQGQRAA